MMEDSLATTFFKDKYLHNFYTPNLSYKTSSIWLALKNKYSLLQDVIWVAGSDSDLDFWRDNWLGYKIIDRIQSTDSNNLIAYGFVLLNRIR